MKIIHTIRELRAHLSTFRRPAFVPTMGNIHDGHLALVRHAKPLGDVLVVSIFVNRLQFLPHEDFDSYPRTWEADCRALSQVGCDVLFAPDELELFPEPQTFKVHPPRELADTLEGHFRPGFFVGVCTVVLKLFAAVQPSVAVFGAKDYQQLIVIQSMVRQFAMPIDIVACPTQRDEDGLALSSRNRYLTATERIIAVQLHQILHHVATTLRESTDDLPTIEHQALRRLSECGWVPDYVDVREHTHLQKPSNADIQRLAANGDLIVLGAAKLGRTRLIDNVIV